MGNKVDTKLVTVSYGLFHNPNKAGIARAIRHWGSKGYTLASRNERQVGCLTLVFTLWLARGKTELTFTRAK